MVVGGVGRVAVGCSLVSQLVIAGLFDSHDLIVVEVVAAEGSWEYRTSPFRVLVTARSSRWALRNLISRQRA